MAITQAIANSFKKELLEGQHEFQFGGDKFKLALYSSSATLNSATTSYTTTGQVGDSGTYTAGGGALVQPNPSTAIGSGTGAGVAYVDFDDLSFTSATITARGALIYNTSSATTNAAVAVLDFGSDKTSTSGTFTVVFPAFTTSAAILRISG